MTRVTDEQLSLKLLTVISLLVVWTWCSALFVLRGPDRTDDLAILMMRPDIPLSVSSLLVRFGINLPLVMPMETCPTLSTCVNVL